MGESRTNDLFDFVTFRVQTRLAGLTLMILVSETLKKRKKKKMSKQLYDLTQLIQ